MLTGHCSNRLIELRWLAIPIVISFGAFGSAQTRVPNILSNPGKATANTELHMDYRGRSLTLITGSERLKELQGVDSADTLLESDEVDCHVEANEFIVSWNAPTPPGCGLKLEARAIYPDHKTTFYTLGYWSPDSASYPRVSVKNQKDADGDVQTDTLVLNTPCRRLQLRVTLHANASMEKPDLKLLAISAADTRNSFSPAEPLKAVWGKEITVPGRTQLGWPDAAGWCSPTSTAMVLAFWSKRLNRKELDIPVPEAAHAIFDSAYNGTGNWPFNTAFAGSFPGIRAYVSRFSDVSELESWIAAGLPPVVSVSYDLLKGTERPLDPGHLMVCVGFTANGDIILNDPAHHPEKGEPCRRIFPRANFIKAWAHSSNAVYLIYKEGSRLPKNVNGHW